MHASSTVGLGITGTIHLDHVTAEGQTCSNNNFGRGHERLVRCLNNSEDMNESVFGTFHQLPEELRRSSFYLERKMHQNLERSSMRH